VIVMAIAAFPFLLLASPAPAPTPRTDAIRDAVRALGRSSDNQSPTLKLLATEPRSAVAALIDELAVVRRPPQAFRPAMLVEREPRAEEVSHAIWCVRGLGYLTGLTFVAPSRHWFARHEVRRRALLLREVENEDENPPGRAPGKQFPYFATWMSQDSSFIAPEDAQRAIIAQWRAWHAVHGATHRYQPDESWDWYFGGLAVDSP
jgi:hypothetical protein